MDAWTLVLDVVILLGVATCLGLLTQRAGLGMVVGVLLAGVLLGPSALGLFERGVQIEAAGELGVALLLFTIGLEFSWSELSRLGRRVAIAGFLQIALTMLAVAGLAAAAGLASRTAFVVGAMVALSSTATVLTAFKERAELDSLHARISVGVLLLQDMAVVPLVVLVAALAGGASGTETFLGIVGSVAAVALLAGVLFVLSRRVYPRIMGATAGSGSRELPILVSVVTCLGAAWLAHRLHVSPGVGAFVAGLLLAGTPFATRARADVGVLRTLFVTTFFATVGMRADLGWIVRNVPQVVAATVALMLVKAVVVAAIAMALGIRPRAALAAGLCLSQVGEFAFVLAGVGGVSGLVGPGLEQLLVTSAVLSLGLTPWLVARAPDAGDRLEALLARLGWRRASRPRGPRREPRSGHVIVVGLGPSGRGAALALQARGLEVLAMELNPRAVALAEREGIPAFVGDGASEDALEHAHVANAAVVVVTLSDLRPAIEAVGAARAAAPHVPVIVRGRYHVYALHLLSAGATMVVDEEWETGGLLGQAAAGLVGRPEPDAVPVAEP